MPEHQHWTQDLNPDLGCGVEETSLPLGTNQDPQWIAESTDGTEPYRYCVFLPICTGLFHLMDAFYVLSIWLI